MLKGVASLKRHPLSEICGAIPVDEYEDLVKDIRKNGVLNPIVLYEGKILDGWHRYLAAKAAGNLCMQDARSFSTTQEASDYIISANLYRRHLTPGKRASIVVKLREWIKKGQSKSNTSSDVFDKGSTEKDMAREARVSVPTIQRAKAEARREEAPSKEDLEIMGVAGNFSKLSPSPKKAKPPKKDSKLQARVDSLELELREQQRVVVEQRETIADLQAKLKFLKQEKSPSTAQREKTFISLRESVKQEKKKAWDWQTKHNDVQKENFKLKARLKRCKCNSGNTKSKA